MYFYQHFDNIYKKQDRFDLLIKLYEYLEKKNKNITMIAFNYNQTHCIYKKLHHYYIPVSYDIDFNLSKNKYITDINCKIIEIIQFNIHR